MFFRSVFPVFCWWHQSCCCQKEGAECVRVCLCVAICANVKGFTAGPLPYFSFSPGSFSLNLWKTSVFIVPEDDTEWESVGKVYRGVPSFSMWMCRFPLETHICPAMEKLARIHALKGNLVTAYDNGQDEWLQLDVRFWQALCDHKWLCVINLNVQSHVLINNSSMLPLPRLKIPSTPHMSWFLGSR